MTTPSQRYLQKFGLSDPAPNAAEQTDQQAGSNRRDFIKNVGMTGLALGAFINAPITQTIEHSTSKVNRASAPSDLKITDMRYAVVMNGGGRCPATASTPTRVFMAWGKCVMAPTGVMLCSSRAASWV